MGDALCTGGRGGKKLRGGSLTGCPRGREPALVRDWLEGVSLSIYRTFAWRRGPRRRCLLSDEAHITAKLKRGFNEERDSSGKAGEPVVSLQLHETGQIL